MTKIFIFEQKSKTIADQFLSYARTAADKTAAHPEPYTTPKSRIASTLGLSRPPQGRTIPVQKQKAEKSVEMKRVDIGASLSIFGSKNELPMFHE